MPLSEYLVAHLSSRGRLKHADGKARFIALARPLIEKIAPGVYRDLLLERIAAGDWQYRRRALQQWLGQRLPRRASRTAHGSGGRLDA